MVTFSLFATCFAYLGFSFAAPVPVLSLSQGLDISFQLQNILDNTDKNPGYRYPTDFTRGIVPVRAGLAPTLARATYEPLGRKQYIRTMITGIPFPFTPLSLLDASPSRQMFGSSTVLSMSVMRSPP